MFNFNISFSKALCFQVWASLEWCVWNMEIPTNTPRVFHVETTWKRSFPRRFNMEYTWSVCRVNIFEASCFQHSKIFQVAAWNYKSLMTKLFMEKTLKMKTASLIKAIKNKKKYFQFFLDRTRTLVLLHVFTCPTVRPKNRV